MDRTLKILIIDNCVECGMVGIGTKKGKEMLVCCITGTEVSKYDADFMKNPTFPDDCPLKDYVKDED